MTIERLDTEVSLDCNARSNGTMGDSMADRASFLDSFAMRFLAGAAAAFLVLRAQAPRSEAAALGVVSNATADQLAPGGSKAADPTQLAPQEREKMLFDHRLQLWRIGIEKGVLAALLAAAALFGNRLIEEFKTEAARTHFFSDKRLDAALKIRLALSNVTEPMFEVTNAICTKTDPELDLEALNDGIEKLGIAINSNNLLFDDQTLQGLQRGYNVVAGVADRTCAVTCEDREFLQEVSRYMTGLLRREIDSKLQADSSFAPVATTLAEIDKMGAPAYFRRNLEAWTAKRGMTLRPVPQSCPVEEEAS